MSSVADKTPLWLRLIATGAPGHGSTPVRDVAVDKLLLALGRLLANQTPIKVVPEVQKFFADTAGEEPENRRRQYQGLRTALRDPGLLPTSQAIPVTNASVRNTISVTRLQGSDKVNVGISRYRCPPASGRRSSVVYRRSAAGDCRGEYKDRSAVIFSRGRFSGRSGSDEGDTGLAKVHDNDAPVVAPLVRGFTDCHFFRAKEISCLGFMPLRNIPSEEGLVHGVNERIALDSLRSGARSLYELVHKFAAQ